MRIRFKWCLTVIFVALVGAVMAVVNNVDYPWQNITHNEIWLSDANSIGNVEFSSLLVSLPSSYDRKSGVKIYDENGWQVYRAYPSGHLDVFFRGHQGRLSAWISLVGGAVIRIQC